MERVVIFVGMYMQLHTVLCYIYTYDMIFCNNIFKIKSKLYTA